MPFADKSGNIAARFKNLRYRYLICRQTKAGIKRDADPVDLMFKPKPLLISPGDYASTRRAANWACYVAIRAENAIVRQRINVRCGNVGAAIKTNVAIPQIVGQNDKDVRLLFCFLLRINNIRYGG